MKWLDRFIQARRFAKARGYIREGDRVLDVGSSDGALFRAVPGIGEYLGIDPLAQAKNLGEGARLIAGQFPDALPDDRAFDAITLLAVLEHVPPDEQVPLAENCSLYLKPGGRLIITVPSPRVDAILGILKLVRLIDGMSLEEHYGFDVRETPNLFSTRGLKLIERRTFQAGLNNLFVFEKPAELESYPAQAAGRGPTANHEGRSR